MMNLLGLVKKETGFDLYSDIKRSYEHGNLPYITYGVTHFDYRRESQDISELHYFCKIGYFLLENRLYQQFYNFLNIITNQNTHFIRSFCNDENAGTRLKLFETLCLADQHCLEDMTYTILYATIDKTSYMFRSVTLISPDQIQQKRSEKERNDKERNDKERSEKERNDKERSEKEMNKN